MKQLIANRHVSLVREAGDREAIVAATAAGCSPVRATVSPDGQTVLVAARGDNRVLAFSAGLLESDPAHALLGFGDSGGKAPVGLTLFDRGKQMAVANCDTSMPPYLAFQA